MQMKAASGTEAWRCHGGSSTSGREKAGGRLSPGEGGTGSAQGAGGCAPSQGLSAPGSQVRVEENQTDSKNKRLAVPSDAHGERQQGRPRQAPKPWPWGARPPAGSPDWVLSPFSPKEEERVDSPTGRTQQVSRAQRPGELGGPLK